MLIEGGISAEKINSYAEWFLANYMTIIALILLIMISIEIRQIIKLKQKKRRRNAHYTFSQVPTTNYKHYSLVCLKIKKD